MYATIADRVCYPRCATETSPSSGTISSCTQAFVHDTRGHIHRRRGNLGQGKQSLAQERREVASAAKRVLP
jgi:hypothetical protein